MILTLADNTKQEVTLPERPRILIIRRNGIGDLLTAMPLLYWSKENLHAQITLVTEHSNCECAGLIANPPWDEMITIPKGNKTLTGLSLLLKIRKLKFDIAINAKIGTMQLMTAIIALSNAKIRRCGIQNKGWSKPLEALVNAPFSAKTLQQTPHQANQTLHILAPSSLQCSQMHFAKMKKAPLNYINDFESDCTKQGVAKSNQQRILINITNNRAASKPKIDQVIEALKDHTHHQIILLSIKSDEKNLTHWKTQLTQHTQTKIATIISPNLPYALAAIQSSDLVITGDGGFMHITAACGTKMIALFGQTSIDRWRPLSTHNNAKCIHHAQSASEIPPNEISTLITEMLN